jgi:hypothetical protein
LARFWRYRSVPLVGSFAQSSKQKIESSLPFVTLGLRFRLSLSPPQP